MSIGEVLPTNEARARLNAIAAGFDADGSHAEPVVFGSHRRAQGVIVSWELWQRIAPAVEDVLDKELATRRLATTKGKGKWLTRAEVDATLRRGKTSKK
jgi:hypothetical protein